MSISSFAGAALALLSCLPACAFAQCSSSNYFPSSVFVNDNATGTYAFSTITNAALSDDQYATATLPILTGNTQYLKATGFNLSVPLNATICGVEVQIERSAGGITLLATVNDNAVRIVKNGTVTGTNHAISSDWTGTDITTTYGSSSDLWGATLTPTDVNSANFGVAISASINGVLGIFPSAKIDQVRIRVHYNITVPILLHDFRIVMNKDLPLISCFLENDENNPAEVFIQRSVDRHQWTTISSHGNIMRNNHITYLDDKAFAGTNYYRVIVYSQGHLRDVSAIKKIDMLPQNKTYVYPNPAKDIIHVLSAQGSHIIVYNIYGRKVMEQRTGKTHLFIGGLPDGMYYAWDGARYLPFLKK